MSHADVLKLYKHFNLLIKLSIKPNWRTNSYTQRAEVAELRLRSNAVRTGA